MGKYVKKALYEQLTWHGFSSSAVQYAIDHLNAD
ncbi:choline binding protein, partial [Streptococcus mitis 13/39]